MEISTTRFGGGYGGWELDASRLNARSVVYSAGVGTDVSFDVSLMGTYGLTVHAFDPTPGIDDWVEAQGLSKEFVLHSCGLAGRDADVPFFPPTREGYQSFSMVRRGGITEASATVPVRRVSTLMASLGHTRLDLLKMDIEGAEYEVLRSLVEDEIYPTQILVEFHHRYREIGISRTKRALRSLRNRGYRVIAISKTGKEYTFLRCD